MTLYAWLETVAPVIKMIPITLSEALDKTNNHGRFQAILFLLCSLLTGQEVFHICLELFTAKPIPWRWNDEEDIVKRVTLPPCYSERKWVFTENSTSIFSDFSLYCSPLKLYLIPCLFFLGRVCGFLSFWSVSVQFGRRWPVIIGIWANMIVAWLLGCSLSYEVYVILRALDGFTLEGFILLPYVLMIECMNESARQPYATQYRSLQGLGFMFLSGAAYFSPNWKVLCLIMGTLITLHAAILSAFLPESPKWLLAKGRSGEIVSFIHRVSTWNNRRIRDQFYIIDGKKKREVESLSSERELVTTFLSLLIIWSVIHIAEYLLYFNVLYLPGNAYLHLLLLGICDIPGRSLPLSIMDRLGRKRTIVLWNCLAGVFLLACSVDHNIVRTLFYLLSKLVLAGCIILVKVYTNELSPASDGSSLYMYCYLATRIVGMGVPFLIWLNVIHYGLVYAVAGGAVFLSPLFLTCLPETKGRPKPESVHEFVSLYYGARFRPAQNGHGLSGGSGREASNKDQLPGSSTTRGSATTAAAMTQPPVPRRIPAWQAQTSNGHAYTIADMSNTDIGNLSLFDPDIERLKLRSHALPTLESTRISDQGGSSHVTPIRYHTYNGRPYVPQSRAGREAAAAAAGGTPGMVRNASYESSLNTMMSDTPTYSGNTEEELIKRNSLVNFTPKTSVKKNFSLSKV